MGVRRVGSLTALIVTVATGWLAVVPASGQASATATQSKESTSARLWSPPLLPDGHPDFQGVWVNNSATPLERPKALEGRAFLTDEEVAALKRRADHFRENDSDFAGGSSENLHLIERFTRSAADTIDYEVTVSDPGAWTRPWTALVHLKQSSDRMFEYACHEGNARTVTDMLLGAHAADSSTIEVPAIPK